MRRLVAKIVPFLQKTSTPSYVQKSTLFYTFCARGCIASHVETEPPRMETFWLELWVETAILWGLTHRYSWNSSIFWSIYFTIIYICSFLFDFIIQCGKKRILFDKKRKEKWHVYYCSHQNETKTNQSKTNHQQKKSNKMKKQMNEWTTKKWKESLQVDIYPHENVNLYPIFC